MKRERKGRERKGRDNQPKEKKIAPPPPPKEKKVKLVPPRIARDQPKEKKYYNENSDKYIIRKLEKELDIAR